MITGALEIFIPGPPRGQGRPRFSRAGDGVRTFTDRKTRSYAAQVQTEWISAGRPELPDGPYRMEVLIALARPAGHFRRDGLRLSAAGRRAEWPTRPPDLDNALKLVLDALCAVGALPDDRKLADVRVAKGWQGAVRPGWLLIPDQEGVLVRAWSLVSKSNDGDGGGQHGRHGGEGAGARQAVCSQGSFVKEGDGYDRFYVKEAQGA